MAFFCIAFCGKILLLLAYNVGTSGSVLGPQETVFSD